MLALIIMTYLVGRVLSAHPLVLRVMGSLTSLTAVDCRPTLLTFLKLYLPSRLVQLAQLAGGVGAADELS